MVWRLLVPYFAQTKHAVGPKLHYLILVWVVLVVEAGCQDFDQIHATTLRVSWVNEYVMFFARTLRHDEYRIGTNAEPRLEGTEICVKMRKF